ncbi:NAC domain-containing protein 35-like [Phragmites australis]|uniref:NAC domain-containing protein 35-like n=1 Tax=Phragmites australis TaxID=29695 RepID=UPI002D76B35A|nr:NAC domain-containing protein 35-like [Phragmites australis]
MVQAPPSYPLLPRASSPKLLYSSFRFALAKLSLAVARYAMSRDIEDGHGAAGSVLTAAGGGGGGGGGAGSSEAAAVSGGGRETAADSHDNDLVMPGFRFHPTEEELIEFYLRRKVEGKRFNVDLIADLDLYRFDPWELPAMAVMGGKEWFFYVPRDRKYRNGDRPNRVTASGYWKATGADRMIRGENSRPIGLKKTLVFYSGKAPKGVRSSWIMNEYRLPPAADTDPLIHKSEISLCRVYKRSGIDDGQPSSARRTASRTVVRTGRHGSSPSSSTQLSPTQQPSSFHLLQGECSSASPPATMDQVVITTHNAPQLLPPPTPQAYASSTNSIAAVAPQPTGSAAVLTSTYSLLSMVATPMGSSRPVDELSTLVGHSQAYANLLAPTGSHFLSLPSPQTTPEMTPLGVLPMGPPLMSSVADKLSWDWNPVPDTTARDYNASGFK